MSELQNFSHNDGQGYRLSLGNLEAVRLNYQHYLWREALKFNIHPSIEVDNVRAIADVATGTGIWLNEVAQTLNDRATSSASSPSGESLPKFRDAEKPGNRFSAARVFDGFDIDLRHTPHAHWNNDPRVDFHQWNIFEDPPERFHGRYDLVHVRLLVLVLADLKAAATVVRRLARLLKPGGYLQWDELDVVNMHVKRVDDQVKAPTPALDELCTRSRANGRNDWTLNLPQTIADVRGDDQELLFENSVHHQLYGDIDSLVRPFAEQHLLTMQSFAEGLARSGKVDAAKQYSDLVETAYEETKAGAALHIPRIIIVARRK